MRFQNLYPTFAAFATLGRLVQSLPQAAAHSNERSEAFDGYPTGSPLSQLAERDAAGPQPVEAFLFANQLNGIHGLYTDGKENDPKFADDVSNFLAASYPEDIPTKHKNIADTIPDVGFLTEIENLIVWPQPVYDIVVNTITKDWFLDAWKKQNKRSDKAPPEPPAAPTEAAPPPEDSASSSPATEPVAENTASVHPDAIVAIIAGVNEGGDNSPSPTVAVQGTGASFSSNPTASATECTLAACIAMAEPYPTSA